MFTFSACFLKPQLSLLSRIVAVVVPIDTQSIKTMVYQGRCVPCVRRLLARYVVPTVEYMFTEDQDRQSLRQQFLFETRANNTAFDSASQSSIEDADQRAQRMQMIDSFVRAGLLPKTKEPKTTTITPFADEGPTTAAVVPSD